MPIPESPPAADSSTPPASLLVECYSAAIVWSAVYPVFMPRDLKRARLRKIVHAGCKPELDFGFCSALQQVGQDYQRFSPFSVAEKADCHLPFQRFRVTPGRVSVHSPLRVVGGANG